MVIVVKEEILNEKKARVASGVAYKFRDPSTMTTDELTDPNYALKQLVKRSGGKISITCSKCHHCR